MCKEFKHQVSLLRIFIFHLDLLLIWVISVSTEITFCSSSPENSLSSRNLVTYLLSNCYLFVDLKKRMLLISFFKWPHRDNGMRIEVSVLTTDSYALNVISLNIRTHTVPSYVVWDELGSQGQKRYSNAVEYSLEQCSRSGDCEIGNN